MVKQMEQKLKLKIKFSTGKWNENEMIQYTPRQLKKEGTQFECGVNVTNWCVPGRLEF